MHMKLWFLSYSLSNPATVEFIWGVVWSHKNPYQMIFASVGRICCLCCWFFAQGGPHSQSWSIWYSDQPIHRGKSWSCKSSSSSRGIGSASGKTLCFLHHLEGIIFFWRSTCIVKMLMFKQERAFSRKRSFRNKLKKQALQKREALVSW